MTDAQEDLRADALGVRSSEVKGAETPVLLSVVPLPAPPGAVADAQRCCERAFLLPMKYKVSDVSTFHFITSTYEIGFGIIHKLPVRALSEVEIGLTSMLCRARKAPHRSQGRKSTVFFPASIASTSCSFEPHHVLDNLFGLCARFDGAIVHCRHDL